MNGPAIACLTTAVYAAGSVPTLLVGAQPPARVRAAGVRGADVLARARQQLVLDVCALALLLSLDPVKGVRHV